MRNKNINFKNLLIRGVFVTLLFALSSCFKDFKDDYLFTDFRVEFDISSWESKAPGKTYPVVGPLEKGSGIHRYQINLLGQQITKDQVVNYRVESKQGGVQEGVHYRLVDQGKVVIKANESQAFVEIEVLDFPAEQGVDTLVLELIESEGVLVSKNYSQLGVSISLTGPPSAEDPLFSQLGPDKFYNSIYIDPLNLDLPVEVQQKLQQSADNLAAMGDGTRRLQHMSMYFDQDETVRVIAHYNGGGGNSLTASAIAIWNYKMELNATGAGKLVFVDANGNGNGQKDNFAPILTNYLELHTFQIDWYKTGTAINSPHKAKWGGLFRVDVPESFLIGSLESLDAAGAVKPFPQSKDVFEMFTDGAGGFYTGLVVDPLDPVQSEAFKSIWNANFAHVEAIAGRKLHKFMLYFNPVTNFQDVRVVLYYFSAANGKLMGQVRSQFKVDTDGEVKPFTHVFQDANGAAVRSPQLFDNFFYKKSFVMSRNGSNVRFTAKDDPTLFFEGELGNHPLSVTQFWP